MLSVTPWLFFTTETQRPLRVLKVGCPGRISFRIFRVFRGYIPHALAGPAVAGALVAMTVLVLAVGPARIVAVRARFE